MPITGIDAIDSSLQWLSGDAFTNDPFVWDESAQVYVRDPKKQETLIFIEQEKNHARQKDKRGRSPSVRSPSQPRSRSEPPSAKKASQQALQLSARPPRAASLVRLQDKLKQEEEAQLAIQKAQADARKARAEAAKQAAREQAAAAAEEQRQAAAAKKEQEKEAARVASEGEGGGGAEEAGRAGAGERGEASTGRGAGERGEASTGRGAGERVEAGTRGG
jgi:colicin import membrane protein